MKTPNWAAPNKGAAATKRIDSLNKQFGLQAFGALFVAWALTLEACGGPAPAASTPTQAPAVAAATVAPTGTPVPPPATAISAPPTQPPTAGISAEDPKTVLALFFLSIDTQKIDSAMTVVSHDVVFNIGSTSGVGADQLKAYMQDQGSKGVNYIGGNITATGNTVKFTVEAASSGGSVTYSDSSMIVEGGKIRILTLK